jgi:hypothetical protein
MALTLMQLRDVVQDAKFAENVQQKQALEILETIAEEAEKSKLKKLSVTAMISTLAGLVSSAAIISDKAPDLIEKLKGFWQ